eukprot:TRINITY_DN18667_c0_g1_i1.p1 TRINITY_DN18667_c0_g1~~TRINITY_DN18667_c0_g1_i1.p1  ORF type:complete len:659 (+),score=220.65 TRINITY_DN18667_c0_g1_i1:69-2045(+)
MAAAGDALPALDDWTVDEVCQRLTGCAWASPHFRHKCRLHRIDGKALQELTKEDLRDDFRITELGTIKEILRNIKRLREGKVLEVTGGRATPAVPPTEDDEWQVEPVPARAETPQPSSAARGGAAVPAHPAAGSARLAAQLQRQEARAATAKMNTLLTEETPLPSLAGPTPTKRKAPPAADHPGVPEAPALPSPGAWAGSPLRTPSLNRAPAAAAETPAAAEPREPAAATPQQQQQESDAPPPSQQPAVRRQSSEQRLRRSVFRPGILELERRFAAARQLFDLWDESSNISEDGSGFIEFEELRDVLAPYYGWGPDEKDRRARMLMGALDKSGDQKIDADEFQRFISSQTLEKRGRDFDAFVDHMRLRVSEETRSKEGERRERSLRNLFRKWDADGSGYIDPAELRSVVVRYNDYSAAQGKHQAQLLLTERDENRDGRLELDEFIALMTALTKHLSPEDFDFMSYRVTRTVEDILQDQRRGFGDDFRPLSPSDLRQRWDESSQGQPLLLYGRGIDPSKQVEKLAESVGAPLRPFLIRHEKGERSMLKDLRRWGFGKGHWVYVMLDYDLERAENFLRRVGVMMQQQPVHTIHRRFRLWVMVPTHRFIRLPYVLRLHGIPVDLEHLRVRREAEFRARQQQQRELEQHELEQRADTEGDGR